jgi:tRNA(Leu) C34 or U34 (ribose-2'-O)-methylase TrmL
MKKHIQRCIVLLLLLLAETVPARDAVSTYHRIEKAQWLLGKWQQKTVERIVYEAWSRLNDSTYKGESYFITGHDTTLLEQVSLEERRDNLFYIPTVQNQNNRQPVVFALTTLSERQMIFECCT